MKWIKASEKLPDNSGYYFVKVGPLKDKTCWGRNKILERTKEGGVEIEWLDEIDPEERTFSVKEAVEIHTDGVILGNKQGLHNAWESHQQYFKVKFGIDI